ncbi:hypothetical protein J6590_081408, partial [Homalodisca vitripennis]
SPQPEDIVHSSRNWPTVVRVGHENLLNRVFTLNNGVVKIHSGLSSSSLSIVSSTRENKRIRIDGNPKMEENALKVFRITFDVGFNINRIIDRETGLSILHYATNTDGRLCIIPSSITYLPAYVKLLVKNGADPNRECNEHLTPTALAIIEDNSEILTLLISLGADPDRIVELDGEQVTLLQLAVSLYNFKIVRLLLENGADPDKSAPATGETALHVAARARPLERRKLIALQSTLYTLIARGASLETTRNDGFTPLQVAILYRRYDEARILIIGGSRLNSTIERGEFRGRTSFHLAASSLDVDLIDLCLKYGADVNVCDRHDGIDLPASTLMAAIYDFKDKGVDNSEVVVEILKMFTRCNFPVNVIQDFWECVKIFTLKIKSRIVFKMLDSALNTQNDFLIKLMHRDVRCIEKIVAAGAELRCCSLGTPFPLNYIASKGDARIMIILLSGGVQTNRLDESGETALHKAASMGYVDCCRLLLEYGAIYNYKSRHKCHRTPAQLAKFVGHTGVTSLLSTIDRYSKRLQIGKFKQPNPDDELFTAVMNCRSSGGTTLLGSAVHLALKREAEILMGLRLGMSDAAADTIHVVPFLTVQSPEICTEIFVSSDNATNGVCDGFENKYALIGFQRLWKKNLYAPDRFFKTKMYESIKELRWDTKMLTVKGNDGHEQSNHRLGSDVRRGDIGIPIRTVDSLVVTPETNNIPLKEVGTRWGGVVTSDSIGNIVSTRVTDCHD